MSIPQMGLYKYEEGNTNDYVFKVHYAYKTVLKL